VGNTASRFTALQHGLSLLWYAGQKFADAAKLVCGETVRMEVISRIGKAFETLPKRWIVERTLGWLNRFRRLSKDYALYSETSEGIIYSCLMHLMARRLAALDDE
jgi:putative transposase